MERTKAQLFQSGYHITHRLMCWLPLLTFIILLFALVTYATRGFDITDESFYILWSNQPQNVIASPSQFGYYTGLLYRLANQSITAFRLIGLFTLLAIASYFAHTLTQFWYYVSQHKPFYVHCRRLITAMTLLGTLVFYNTWILTPSYNWLVLVAIFMVGSGLLLYAANTVQKNTDKQNSAVVLRSGLLVGFGGSIAFMGKPTSAAILALSAVLWLCCYPSPRHWQRFIGLGLFAATLVIILHALLLKNGFANYYHEIFQGQQILSTLGAGHTLPMLSKQVATHLYAIGLEVRYSLAFKCLFIVFFLALPLRLLQRHTLTKWLILLGIAAVNIVNWHTTWQLHNWEGMQVGYGATRMLLVFVLSGLMAKMALPRHIQHPTCPSLRHCLSQTGLLFLLAISYAFGSSDAILEMSHAYVFLMLAIFMMAMWIDALCNCQFIVSVVSVLSVLILCLLTVTSYQKPYRIITNLSEQTHVETFLMGDTRLKLDKATAAYVHDLKAIAQKSNWKKGMPLIDLTGASPGASVILDSTIIGTPWLIGGYPHSDTYVQAFIDQVPQSLLQAAWVLTAEKGARHVSSDVLRKAGLLFPTCYQALGRVVTGYRHETQVLWKPSNKASCPLTPRPAA